MLPQKTLFEIPVYSMPEQEFDDKWKQHKGELYLDLMRRSDTYENAQNAVWRSCHPYHLWKYNQIIGYIIVSISVAEVCFNEYRSENQACSFDDRTKNYMQDMHIVGNHFRVNDQDSNEEIKRQIRDWLRSLQDYQKKKGHYVDMTTFDNILEYLDIRQAIDDMSRNGL